MRPENRRKREAQIIEAAYEVLETAGPSGLSMQAVAKQAKASLETLYRWYGDKTGLYAALVAANAAEVELAMTAAQGGPPRAVLVALGAQLYDMVTEERAIALNRAAAADASGTLGAALTEEGRARVKPLIGHAIARLDLALPPELAAPLFVDLLLGDAQIRRATGVMPVPARGTGTLRAERAVAILEQLDPTLLSAGQAPG